MALLPEDSVLLRLVLIFGVVALSACTTSVSPNVTFGGPPLVSGNSPQAPLAFNAQPQPPGSLPPGAAGIPANTAFPAPDIASATVKLPRF